MRAGKYGRQLKNPWYKSGGGLRGKKEMKTGLQGIFSVIINWDKKK
jgi:hypothetical protein